MQSSTSELEVLVTELQKKFERLKVLYEQYFMGIEKMEPLVLRKDLTRAVINLTGLHVRNPVIRFKLTSFLQKWNSYQSYWNRTLREIEQGRYARHVVLAKKRADQAGVAFPAEEMGVQLPHFLQEEEDEPEPKVAAAAPAKPQQPPPKPGVSQKPPEPPLVTGMNDAEVRALHQRVVAAQKASGETSEIRFETLVAQLNRQVPKLREEYGGADVQFDVVSRDGKVRLKPQPKRG